MTNVINGNNLYTAIADVEMINRNDVFNGINFDRSSEAGGLLYKPAVKRETLTAILAEDLDRIAKSKKKAQDENEGESFHKHEEEPKDKAGNFRYDCEITYEMGVF